MASWLACTAANASCGRMLWMDQCNEVSCSASCGERLLLPSAQNPGVITCPPAHLSACWLVPARPPQSRRPRSGGGRACCIAVTQCVTRSHTRTSRARRLVAVEQARVRRRRAGPAAALAACPAGQHALRPVGGRAVGCGRCVTGAAAQVFGACTAAHWLLCQRGAMTRSVHAELPSPSHKQTAAAEVELQGHIHLAQPAAVDVHFPMQTNPIYLSFAGAARCAFARALVFGSRPEQQGRLGTQTSITGRRPQRAPPSGRF
jgi:hypothetical protein